MKIAQLHMDSQDRLRFEVVGKSSVKYYVKANHQVEAKRWVWTLNNAIQYAKDSAKEAAKTQTRNTEMLRQAKLAQAQGSSSEAGSQAGTRPASINLVPGTATGLERIATQRSAVGSDYVDDDGAGSVDQSLAGDDVARAVHSYGTTAIEGDADDDDEYGDDASEIEAHPIKRDAFVIAAHGAKLQLDMLSQISSALQYAKQHSPETTLADPNVSQAFDSYDSAVSNLNTLVGDLGRIARDREAYWQYRLEQELNVRRIWEDNMQKVAQDQEELENRIGESEEKRKQAKRALREVLDNQAGPVSVDESALASPGLSSPTETGQMSGRRVSMAPPRARRATIAELNDIAASDSEDDDEEFFDAVGAGEVEVVDELPEQKTPAAVTVQPIDGAGEVKAVKQTGSRSLESSFAGYEEPLRKRLKMDADNRPKISLWVSRPRLTGLPQLTYLRAS